jgi:hypothetical protein
VAVCVRFAVFVHCVALPFGAIAEHNKRIVARVCVLVLDEKLDEFVEIDLIFGDDTSDRGDVGGVERCKPGVAAKDAENADPLAALDGIGGAGDRRRAADALLGVADVVVHRLRDSNDPDAKFVEVGRVAERVVAADGNKVMVDAKHVSSRAVAAQSHTRCRNSHGVCSAVATKLIESADFLTTG